MSGCQNCLAFLPCVINKLAVCKVHCVCCSKWKIGENPCDVCVPQWPWVELQLINSIDDVALALLFFCSLCRAWTWESHLPSLGEEGGRASQLCSVFTGEGLDPTSPAPLLPFLLFSHHSFATFMWSTGWKFNLITCLQARNMILKPVTVKQRCHLHNDPSKIGLQPLPWQLVDKLKNGGRALRMDGRLGGCWAGKLIAVRNGLALSLLKPEL